MTVWILLLTIFLLFYPTAAEAEPALLVPEDVMADYERLLNGRDPLALEDFSGTGSRRDVVEMILIQQALEAAEVNLDFRFEVENSYEDILQGLVAGQALATGTTAWLSDLMPRHADTRITTALIGQGEFVAGIYVRPDNEQALQVSQADDLKALTGISSRSWRADWVTLEALDLGGLIDAASWSDMVSAVLAGEADFLLAPFQPTPGMVLTVGEQELVPIPGVKLGLVGSRHLAVSRAHPEGSLFNSALQLGLLRLKEEGVVRQAYTDAGFYHPEVTDWTLITPESRPPLW